MTGTLGTPVPFVLSAVRTGGPQRGHNAHMEQIDMNKSTQEEREALAESVADIARQEIADACGDWLSLVGGVERSIGLHTDDDEGTYVGVPDGELDLDVDYADEGDKPTRFCRFRVRVVVEEVP